VRILHLLKHGVQGNGHVHVAVDLACSQAGAGHEVSFVSSGGSYDRLLADHGVRVVTIPESGGLRGTSASGLGLLRAAGALRPEIMHAHMMSSAVLGYGVAKLVGATLVTTMHNSFERHSVLMRLGRVVVAVSEAERRLLLSRGYPDRKVVTVVNGANGSPREALPGNGIGPLQRPAVMTLCGLHPRKAVGDVISAFAEVRSDFPEWHLNIVGWGPDRERLESIVAERGLQPAVHFLGSTTSPGPLLAVAEARAAGCAVVATAVGGVPEVLDHGRAGQLVPPHNPGAMAEAFRTLMSDREVLADWRARAQQGSEYFTVARMAGDYERLYASLLRSDRGSRLVGALAASPSTR
jgi:glycosyltransferase involved in cell wall biosynthesis